MTRHNLQTHLAWLLGSPHDAYIPRPTIAPLANPIVALGAEPYSLSQFQSLNNEEPLIDRTPSVVTNGHTFSDREQSVRPSFPSGTSAQLQSSETMARLQSGIGSNTKPRLISRALPELAQTPKQLPTARPGTSLGDQYNAACSRGHASKYGYGLVRGYRIDDSVSNFFETLQNPSARYACSVQLGSALYSQ